ncbi:hypothetical protein JCM17960_04710 [Magnetospira thiophila]
MRTVGSHAPRKYGTAAAATQQLINDVGGLKEAEKVCGRGKTVLHDYADPHKPDRSMPIHIVEALEKISGTHPVTEHLAAQAGLLVIDVPAEKTELEWLAHISRVSKEFSDVLRKTYEFLEDDGIIDEREARILLKEIDENLLVLADMRESVRLRVTPEE